MSKNIPRSGKQLRPKTTVKGKRYRCAICHRRSPKAIKTPAPWYCPTCTARRLTAALPDDVLHGDSSDIDNLDIVGASSHESSTDARALPPRGDALDG